MVGQQHTIPLVEYRAFDVQADEQKDHQALDSNRSARRRMTFGASTIPPIPEQLPTRNTGPSWWITSPSYYPIMAALLAVFNVTGDRFLAETGAATATMDSSMAGSVQL